MINRAKNLLNFHHNISAYRLHTNKNHYEILAVPQDSTFKQIKSQYLSQAKIYHPDISKAHSHLYSDLQEAYKALSNVESRKKYDLSLGIKHSNWEKQYLTTDFNREFENNDIYEGLLNKRHEEIDMKGEFLEERLQRKHEKELISCNSGIWLNWRIGIVFVGFSLFWGIWIVCEKIYLNYEGTVEHKIDTFETETTIKMVPLISR